MADKPSDDHASRVHQSFDDLDQKVGGRLDEAGREAIAKVRAAAASRDAAALKEGLANLQEQHGWLYTELAAHPRIAILLDELALLGL
ncbi:MAG: hypothetical protein WEF99_07205 [Thermoanaerobaculia bacterium]